MTDFSRLYRNIKMMLGIGRVTATSDDGVIQKLQYRTPLEVRSSTPRMAEFGFSSLPPVGSDAVVVFPGGDRSNPVIIATNHKSYRHTGLQEGESVLYDQWGQYIKLTESGIEVEANGKPVTVSNATTVTIVASEKIVADTPRFECTGDIIDNSGSNSATLKDLRDAYDGHTHAVNNVESGSSSVTSQAPGEQV